MSGAIHITVEAQPGYIVILDDQQGSVRVRRVVSWLLRGNLPKPQLDEDDSVEYDEWDDTLPEPAFMKHPNIRRWKTLTMALRAGANTHVFVAENHDDFDWAGHVDDVPGPKATMLDAEVPGWRAQFGRTVQ